MEKVPNNGLTALNTKAIGVTAWPKEEERFTTPTKICTQVSFIKIEQMVMEHISMKTVKDTKENGKMIFNTVRVPKSLKMDLSMRESSEMARNKGTEYMNGPMDQNIKVIGLKIISMDQVSIHGLMEENTKENGRIICYMGVVFTLGQMVENMMVNIMMTKNMVMEFSHGQMVVNMTELG